MKRVYSSDFKTFLIAMCASMGAFALPSAQAANTNSTWTGNADNATFETGGNWTPTTAPGSTTAGSTTDTSVATFNTAAGATITLPSFLNLKSITFNGNAGSFSLDGSGTGIFLTGTGVVTFASTTVTTPVTETIAAPLTLEGNYSFTNNAASSSDVIDVTGNITDGAIATVASGSIVVGQGLPETLTLGGTNTGANTISGVITDGPGTPTINNGKQTTAISVSGNWTLTNSANTYSGNTSLLAGGNLTLTAGAGTTGADLVNSKATFTGGTLTVLGAATGTSSASVAGILLQGGTGLVDTLTFNDNGGAGTTLNFGSLGYTNVPSILNVNMASGDILQTTTSLSSATQSGLLPYIVLNGTDLASYTIVGSEYTVTPITYTTLTGAAPTYTNATTDTIKISSASTGNIQVTAAATASNSLVMSDTSARTIAMNGNTITYGNTSVRAGEILGAEGAGALTIGSSVNDGAVTVAGNANHTGSLLLINDSSNVDTMNSVIQDPGTGFEGLAVALLGSGEWALNGANTYSAGTYINGGGTVDINSSTALGTGFVNIATGSTIDNTSGSAVTLSTTGAQTLNGTINYRGTNALNLGTGGATLGSAVTFNTAANVLTEGGVISGGSNTLTKTGAGALVLNGANTYTGATTVNAGTLSGTGSFAGALVLNAGGNLNPGNLGTSTGSMAGTSLTMNGGSSLTFALGATPNANDLLTLSGAFTKGTAGIFDVDLTGGTVGDSYDLLNYGSTTFASTDFTAVGDTGTFTLSGGELVFQVTAVPEPATNAMLIFGMLGFGALVFVRRRAANRVG